jgi:hypothetical protein
MRTSLSCKTVKICSVVPKTSTKNVLLVFMQIVGMNLDQSQKHILLNTSDGNDGNLANWRYKILENSIISFVNSIFDLD